MHVAEVHIVKLMTPLLVRLPAGVTCSVTAPARSSAVITGASFSPTGSANDLGRGRGVIVTERDDEAVGARLAGRQRVHVALLTV